MCTRSFPLLLFLPLATACTGKSVDTATPAEDTSNYDTNSGGEDAATFGLPEGASTWAGEGQVSGFTFPIEATL